MSDDMTGKVQTVLGTIGPEEMGPTTTHEHLLIDFQVHVHASNARRRTSPRPTAP